MDPAHYCTSAHLICVAMLRHTFCTLDLTSDPEMFSMVDAGIPGLVWTISTRQADANNVYRAAFDAAGPTSYII